MRDRKSADGAVANLVRSGRKQPQRFRAGSSASTFRNTEQSAAIARQSLAVRRDVEGGQPAAQRTGL